MCADVPFVSDPNQAAGEGLEVDGAPDDSLAVGTTARLPDIRLHHRVTSLPMREAYKHIRSAGIKLVRYNPSALQLDVPKC